MNMSLLSILSIYLELTLPLTRCSVWVNGYYTMVFANGTTERLKMYYCPQISETLISPQAMCADASITFSGFDIHCQDLNNPYARFHSPSGLYTADWLYESQL
jgi:hypothetical protein